MKHLKLCCLLFYTQLCVGQNREFTVSQIDSIVKVIESTSLSNGVSDGIITNPETLKTVGGFADWYYKDSSGKYLNMVYHEQSAYSTENNYYYFYQNRLIYLLLKREFQDEEKGAIKSVGKYYFQNNKVIFKNDDMNYHFDKLLYLEVAKSYVKFWSKRLK